MKIQEKRDQQTVAIGAALGIFALIVVFGATMLWLVGLLGLSGSLVRALQLPVFAVAGLAMVRYLARDRGADNRPQLPPSAREGVYFCCAPTHRPAPRSARPRSHCSV